jgi:hypothetical protein
MAKKPADEQILFQKSKSKNRFADFGTEQISEQIFQCNSTTQTH